MKKVFVAYNFKNNKGSGEGHVFLTLKKFSHTEKRYCEIAQHIKKEYDFTVVTLVNVKELKS